MPNQLYLQKVIAVSVSTANSECDEALLSPVLAVMIELLQIVD